MKKYVLGFIAILLVIGGMIFLYTSYMAKKGANDVKELAKEYDRGNLDGAIDGSIDALESNPNNVDSLLFLAATYAQKGSVTFSEEENANLAIGTADKVLVIDKNNSEAYRIKGYAFEIQEKYVEAHENYDMAIKLNPNNSLALSNKGHAYDLQGDLPQATALYKKAISIDPTNGHALLNLARVYIREGDYVLARTTIDSLISSTPINRFKAEGYQLLAHMSYTEEEFDQALEEINKAIVLDPMFSQALVLKAKIELGTVFDLETQQDIDALILRARADIMKALSINPNQATAYLLLSEIEIITGNKVAQAEMKKRALEAIDLDISLGKNEKDALRSYLNSQVTIENK